jgi:type II secretory pathway pseudopilin PulG
MKPIRRIPRGFLMTELIVSLTVLGMILVAFAVSLDGFRRFNHYQLVRQRCVAAGQATLDSIAATGNALAEDEVAKLWPGIDILVEQTNGAGQWEGMRFVAVRASGRAYHRDLRVRLVRYFSRDHEIAEGQ